MWQVQSPPIFRQYVFFLKKKSRNYLRHVKSVTVAESKFTNAGGGGGVGWGGRGFTYLINVTFS